MLLLVIFWYFSQWDAVTPNQLDFFRCVSSFELFFELFIMVALIGSTIISYIDRKL